MLRKDESIELKEEYDPYAVLGLPKTANLDEVKKAYKRLALQYHPDKQHDKSKSPEEVAENIASAEYLFKEITNAYHAILKLNEKNDEALLEDVPRALTDKEQSEYQDDIQVNINKNDSEFNFTNDSIKSLSNVDGMNVDEIKQRMEVASQKYKNIDPVIKDKAFLWKAEKENCAPIYVFGTAHAATIDKEDFFGDVVDNLIDKVDVVFTEVKVVNDFQFLFNTKRDDYLKNDLLKMVIDKSTGTSSSTTSQKNNINHPTETKTNSNESDISIDEFIAQKAYDRGKRTKHLENGIVREAAGRSRENDKQLYDQLKDINKKDLQDFTENYLTHVSPSSQDLNDENNPEAKRNFFWMYTILSHSAEQKKSSLVVCGAAHNAGQFGLPNLLASEGYTLKPLMKIAPTPKSELVRDVARGGHVPFFKSDPSSKEDAETKVTSNQFRKKR